MEEDSISQSYYQLAQAVENLENEISNLEMLKKQHVNNSKLTEAEEAKKRIAKLKDILKTKRGKYLESKYQSDLKVLEEKFKKDLEEYDLDWENRYQEFLLNSKKMLSDMNIRQNYEIVELTKQLEFSLGKVAKFSNMYLDLKKQQENLIKQQFFQEAHIITKKMQNLEKVESENFLKMRNDKIKAKTDKLSSKHVLEKNSFLKKINDEDESFQIQKKEMHENASVKFRGRVSELTAQYHQDKHLNENDNQLRAKNSSSNSSSTIKKYQSPNKLQKIKKIHSGLVNEDFN